MLRTMPIGCLANVVVCMDDSLPIVLALLVCHGSMRHMSRQRCPTVPGLQPMVTLFGWSAPAATVIERWHQTTSSLRDSPRARTQFLHRRQYLAASSHQSHGLQDQGRSEQVRDHQGMPRRSRGALGGGAGTPAGDR